MIDNEKEDQRMTQLMRWMYPSVMTRQFVAQALTEQVTMDALDEYDTFVFEQEYDEEMAEVDAMWAREAEAERRYKQYLVDLKHKRSQRRAEMEKRKDRAKKRRPDADARIVGLIATTPQPCGKWCVCRDRGKNYNREAFKRNTRREMEY